MADHAPNAGQIAVILVAAGRGSRAGDGIPKQYRGLAGVPLVRRTVDALVGALPDVVIVPVIHPDDTSLFEEAVRDASALSTPVFGGATRQESVLNGLVALKDNPPDYVLIHDAARPFVSKALIERLATALSSGQNAVVPALPVVDTLVRTDGNSRKTVDRANLYVVQTPQGFVYEDITAAHLQLQDKSFTDDASLYEAAGGQVAQVAGDERNFKVTQHADFMKAERMIVSRYSDTRVGAGYDVHRFEEGDRVWLCGVEVPHSRALKGHSDADVALHALTDAVLAAIADGDIGAHFPPTDDTWRGTPSHTFLSFACDRVRRKEGQIANLAVTIICEAPKIGPLVPKMRKRIAEITGIDLDRVSVQATTTEKLGFTGRREGIAAQATATVRLPAMEEAP